MTKTQLLRSAYPAVPLASVLCINICLHQWSYCIDREAEKEEEYAPIGACAIVFFPSETSGSVVTLWPTSRLGSTHPALNVLPLSHHASSCPTSLLLLSPAALCIVIVLFFFPPLRTLVSLSDSGRLCSPLPSGPSPPRVPPRHLCVAAHSLTFFLSRPAALSAYSHFSPLPLYFPHEDSAPAEVDELPQPQ